jgi:hypothetical protein
MKRQGINAIGCLFSENIFSFFKKKINNQGNDTFGKEVKLVLGKMTEPTNVGDTVIIKFPTFTETANMAGISRVLGGYHIQADNVAGLALWRNVAKAAWEKYNQHLGRNTEGVSK